MFPMNTKRITRVVLIFLIVLVNIGCDQVSKKVVRNTVGQHEYISLLGNHLAVTNVENSGAFLSVGNSLPKNTKNIVLSLVPLLVLTFAFIYILFKQSIAGTLLFAICCIVGGGIGNIFDRITYGSVTDFLYINFGIFHTGIFNMADLSIVTGTLMILVQAFVKKKR
jgi:signal peptidase II